MRKLLFFAAVALIGCFCKAQTVNDIDGNEYNTVLIGTQTWMTKNLTTTKYNDGTNIPIVTSDTIWNGLTTDAYSWYNNDSATYSATYGALYNWYAVNTEKLCPTGWHVPANTEWTTLTNYLGGTSIAGGKLKETGTEHWNNPNTAANNSSGFLALPGGCIFKNEPYLEIGNYGFWWSSTESSATNASYRYMYFADGGIHAYSDYKSDGFSVRCISNEVVISGISNSETDEISIYPNPSSENLFVKNSSFNNLSVEIHNIQGELIQSKQNVSGPIDISNLKNGVYFVRISDSGKIKMVKFIKN